jgi:hypothetical protein
MNIVGESYPMAEGCEEEDSSRSIQCAFNLGVWMKNWETDFFFSCMRLGLMA